MTALALTPALAARVVCEPLRVDTPEARRASVGVAELVGPVYGTVAGTEVGGPYRASDHWLAWAEGRLRVLRLPGARLSAFGDVVGFAAAPREPGGAALAWLGSRDPAVVAALRRRLVC